MTDASGIPGFGGPWSSGEITPRAFCVLAPNPSPMTLDGTNTWLIGEPGSGRLGLIDPGPDLETHWTAVVAVAEERDARIDSILLTHGHLDHSEGARAWADRLGCGVRALDPAQRYGAEGLVDGDVIELGDAVVRVISTPGHTADSLSFLLEPDAALLTGDTILGRGTTVVAHPDGTLADYLDTLSRLRDLAAAQDLQTILPGHGPSLDAPAHVIAAYITHREERLDQIRQALKSLKAPNPETEQPKAEQPKAEGEKAEAEGEKAEGEKAMRIVEIVYADVPRSVWPAALLSVRAQLDYLSLHP